MVDRKDGEIGVAGVGSGNDDGVDAARANHGICIGEQGDVLETGSGPALTHADRRKPGPWDGIMDEQAAVE